MTDYRGTEQELWDEDALADDDQKTLVITPRTEQPEAHLQASAPVRDPLASRIGAQSEGASVDVVARFIAEPGQLRPSVERELDAPRRSLAALELLDADDGSEPTGVRAPPLPPALPPALKAGHGETSTLVLGSPQAVRNDITERVTTIPRTHPLANSIAPGGSPLSLRPAPRRSLRWQAALGVAALLAIGGASRLLQSRGEHHAASGTRTDEDETAPVEPRRVAPAVIPTPVTQGKVVLVESGSSLDATWPLLAPEPGGTAPVVPTIALAPRSSAERTAQRDEADKVKLRRVRVGLGGAQLIEREQAASDLPGSAGGQPDRAAIVSALSALTPRLQECVGDEHGIADVTLTVRAPGVVSHALVEGAYAGSDKGSCIARALRSVQLPRFVAPLSRVEYPFQL
ncbi:MAG: Fe-S oxidoreductase [Myxococcaceae bacterium]|nr:Fe-S oxidoreductase [Myxococcaceae bacterium]